MQIQKLKFRQIFKVIQEIRNEEMERMYIRHVEASENTYLPYENVDNKTINTLMREGNIYIAMERFAKIRENLEALFGKGNYHLKECFDSTGAIITITITGKEHCQLIQERMKKKLEREKEIEALAEKIYLERWL